MEHRRNVHLGRIDWLWAFCCAKRERKKCVTLFQCTKNTETKYLRSPQNQPLLCDRFESKKSYKF